MAWWIDEARDRTSERVLGEPWFAVRHAVLHGRIVGEQDVPTVHDRLARVFGSDSNQVLGMLGISRTHKARAHMTVEMLDRVASATDAFARVERLIGVVDAQAWFNLRTEAFGQFKGVALLRSRVGTQYLGTVITGMEHGMFR